MVDQTGPRIQEGPNRRALMQAIAAGAAGWTAGSTGLWATATRASPTPAGALAAAFDAPPPTACPAIYWYWLGGAVTSEGITADLEAMREVGIDQALLFTIGGPNKESGVVPPAATLSPYWWTLVRHATSEARRLGMTLTLNICDGWATASGPWITPECSMQHVVWSEQVVEAGRTPDPLAQPKTLLGYYRDIRVLALPWPEAWDRTSGTEKAVVTVALDGGAPVRLDAAALADPANDRPLVDTDQPAVIEFAFPRPFTLRSVEVRTPPVEGFAPGVERAANSLEVWASDDGASFRRVGALEYPRHGWQTDMLRLVHALPETTARVFRLVHRPQAPGPYREDYDFGQYVRLKLTGLVLASRPSLHHPQVKSGEQWGISRRTDARDLPPGSCVKREAVLDLTGSLAADGRLDWRAPEGRWRLLRIGCTTTGAKNSAAGGAQGLECDKFNPDATRLQFDRWFGEALRQVGPGLAGGTLHGVHVDSWEAGSQNWSPLFAAGFERLRGYDLSPWLATMAGVPLDSADASERVLFDVRRTINDLVQENFFAVVAQLAHEKGCIFSGEVPNPTFPADGFQHVRQQDQPMGEFWLHTPRNDKPTDIKDAVNGARVYGKAFAGAESFTEGLMDWTEQPYTFKALGDHNYCQGINRFMLHVYAAQPWLDRGPGETLSGIGTFFSRTQPWWRPGKAWFDYLRRCQALLQQGQAVCDVAYFIGEDIPARSLLPHQLEPALPAGYAYDSINRDALMTLARVEDGALALPSGVRYRVLALPPARRMTPELAERLAGFVAAGLTLVGPRPDASPSLEHGAAAADARLARAVAGLWGDLDGQARTRRRCGAGTVVWGEPLEQVLRGLETPPDLVFAADDPPVEWTHRRGPGFDLYFLSNPSDRPVRVAPSFRMAGRAPALWRADAAERIDLAAWREQDGRTGLILDLDPRGSVFVVFAGTAGGFDPILPEDAAQPGLALERRGGTLSAVAERAGQWTLRRRSGARETVSNPAAPLDLPVAGPWRLRFADQLAAPKAVTLESLASWSTLADPDLRYYSGAARYETAFSLPPDALEGQRLWLDLGQVADLAVVEINGRGAPALWKPPFALEITGLARPGGNRLAVEVCNTWRNRLIGDSGKAWPDRKTFVVPMRRKGVDWLPHGPDSELSPAGLLGPVRILGRRVIPLVGAGGSIDGIGPT